MDNEILKWGSEFIPAVCPVDRVWTYDVNDGIVFDFGIANDVPVECKPYPASNNLLIVGNTGTGKSVLVNNVVVNLSRRYSPMDLRIKIISPKTDYDYFYKNDKSVVLPHLSSLSCTLDIDYILSVYEELSMTASSRYMHLKKLNIKNIYDYNKQMKECDDTMRYPHIILIVDEFNVILDRMTSKQKKKYIEYVTNIFKLGRAVGISFIYASQTAHSSEYKGIQEQFQVRAVLRCDDAIFTELTKNVVDKKPNIKEKCGYLNLVKYNNDIHGQEMIKIRTPYISDKEILDDIEMLANKSKTLDYEPAPCIYHQDGVNETDIDYKKKKASYKDDTVNQDCLFYLGSGTVINEDNFYVTLNAYNHNTMLICNNDLDKFYRVFKTVFGNLKNTDSIYIDCKEAYLQDLIGGIISESNNVTITDEQSSKIYKTIMDMINSQPKSGYKMSTPNYVILAGWESLFGITEEDDIKLTRQLNELIRKVPYSNTYLILLFQSVKNIPSSILNRRIVKICSNCTSEEQKILLGEDVTFKPTTNTYIYVEEGNGTLRKCKLN